jgi:hypothetical protein
VPYCVTNCFLFDKPGDHQGQVLREWVGLAITDQDLLDAGILLSACRSILRSRPDDPKFTQMALHYRQRGLQALRHAISDVTSPISILTIATALALVFDEVRLQTNIRMCNHVYLGTND